jgi:DNA-binding IclR family transcriptional regulator
MAAPVRRRTGEAVGVITIAGPLLRLTERRMLDLGQSLVGAAAELGMSAATSPLFVRHPS